MQRDYLVIGSLLLMQPIICVAADIPITGEDNPKLHSLDEFMRSFISTHEVPGAALAITKSGKLVYARGIGYSDIDAQTPVQPDSLFRIASVTKPFTATAILQLVERGKIKLDTKAFEFLGL